MNDPKTRSKLLNWRFIAHIHNANRYQSENPWHILHKIHLCQGFSSVLVCTLNLGQTVGSMRPIFVFFCIYLTRHSFNPQVTSVKRGCGTGSFVVANISFLPTVNDLRSTTNWCQTQAAHQYKPCVDTGPKCISAVYFTAQLEFWDRHKPDIQIKYPINI